MNRCKIHISPRIAELIRSEATQHQLCGIQFASWQYRRFERELHLECTATYTTGGSDPYGTKCEEPGGHDGPHEGPHPLDELSRLQWDGGGMCAGDPLPYRNVHTV